MNNLNNLNSLLHADWWWAVLGKYGVPLISALVILGVGWWFAKWLRSMAERKMVRRNIDAALAGFLATIVYVVLLVVVVITALTRVGVSPASLLTLVGAAGLAIGLAFKSSASDFIAGVLLMVQHPFRAGDYVEVAGTGGTVEMVKIFRTTLRTASNQVISVPNSLIYEQNITNYSARATRRLELVVNIRYGDDVDAAKAMLQKLADDEPRVLTEPEDVAPVIWVDAVDGSGIRLLLRVWFKTDEYWDARTDMHEALKRELDQAGLRIPPPQQDVHVHRLEAVPAERAGEEQPRLPKRG
ncbi:MAG TPA: mechanosensitive ion channel domain-containing protein [Gammaproteobacteria bacterium]|nr:mechanosensitive ion channel domain-containing protein [Gammaproteobacteria bacterium]